MNKADPLVTVLLPAYNAEDYINDSVDSVLQQTFTDFELLVINDGSTDRTGELLEAYNDERMTVVHQENMGLVKTLNKGIGLAKGKYIARFDADDICYPDRFKKQIDFLTQNPEYIIVGGDADYTDEHNNFIFRFYIGQYEDEEIRATGFKHCSFVHSSVMVLKQALIDAGGYNERAITFEDHLLWRKISEFGKLKNIKEPLIRVRFNPASVTIDEKWRGKDFAAMKRRSITNGDVTDEDYKFLVRTLKEQDFTEYKKASYHSMLGKKYLWNQHKPAVARDHLRIAMKMMPNKPEPYLLYIISYLPSSWVKHLYNFAKSRSK